MVCVCFFFEFRYYFPWYPTTPQQVRTFIYFFKEKRAPTRYLIILCR